MSLEALRGLLFAVLLAVIAGLSLAAGLVLYLLVGALMWSPT